MIFDICKSSIPGEKLVLMNEKILLRPITIADCTPFYVEWLRDPLVNQFLETRWHHQDIGTVRDFVHNMLISEEHYLFAIILNDNGTHIGNIKLGPINRYHGYADVSYFIGERQCWRKGFATEAIKLVTQFGFEVLHLYRVQAGAYAKNIGSVRALEKAGYRLEGCFRKQLTYADERDDHLWFGMTIDDWGTPV